MNNYGFAPIARACCVFLLSVFLTACVGTPLAAKSSKATAPTAQMFLGAECLIADERPLINIGNRPSSIVSVILTALLDRLVGKGAAIFRNAGKERSSIVSANQDFYLYKVNSDHELQLNRDLSCFTIVIGEPGIPGDCPTPYIPPAIWDVDILNQKGLTEFMHGQASDSITYSEMLRRAEAKTLVKIVESSVRGADDSTIQNQLLRGKICLKKQPSVVFEARFLLSDDSTAFRYEGAHLFVRTPFSGGRKDSRVGVAALIINGPTKDGSGEALALSTIKLGVVKAGAVINPDKKPKSGWIPVPAPSKDILSRFSELTLPIKEANAVLESVQSIMPALKEAIEKELAADPNSEKFKRLQTRKQLLEQQMTRANHKKSSAETALPPHFMPVSVVGSLTETRSENAALLFIADLIDGNKEKIVSSIGSSFIPDVRTAADAEKEKEAKELVNSVSEARAVYFEARALLTTKTAELEKLPANAPESAREALELQVAALEERLAKATRTLNELLVKVGEPTV